MPFLLQFLYGIRAVGFYSVGQRIAVLPLQLFNDSLSQVFFQRAARAQEARGEFWREFRFTLLASSAISLVMLIGLVLFAKPVVALYLGARWDMAGTILVILAPMLALRSVTMSLATTVFVIKRPEWLFAHNVASVAAIALAFGIAWVGGSDLIGFLELLTLLQGAEYLAFGAVLGTAARRRYLSQTASAVG
jgi:O-antigen/teichoic acid export membrane protein